MSLLEQSWPLCNTGGRSRRIIPNKIQSEILSAKTFFVPKLFCVPLSLLGISGYGAVGLHPELPVREFPVP
jgi:hypothetical protein